MREKIVYLNGEYIAQSSAQISVMDRGFLFSDGVYEVIPVYHGKIFRVLEHLERLDRSLAAINLSVSLTHDEWTTILDNLLEENRHLGTEQKIYLQVTRGAHPERLHEAIDAMTPTIFIQTTPLKTRPLSTLKKGFSAITGEDIRWQWCHIKSISLLPNILCAQKAKANNAAEMILIHNGLITEGASSNVFIVKDGIVKTPALNKHILGGITRELLIDLLRNAGLSVEETDITEQDLTLADEIWVTSSTREIFPIISLNHNPVGSGQAGPVWEKAIERYQAYKLTLKDAADSSTQETD